MAPLMIKLKHYSLWTVVNWLYVMQRMLLFKQWMAFKRYGLSQKRLFYRLDIQNVSNFLTFKYFQPWFSY